MDSVFQRACLAYDTGCWILLCWPCETQEFFVADSTLTHIPVSNWFSGFAPLIRADHLWFFWGYSLVFSKTSTNGFIGNVDNIGLRGVLAQRSAESDVPDILFALFQGMFASFTPALIIGATAERGRILPCMIFLFLWATLVYDPLAYWTWNPNGWANSRGVLDFAGGTPVHISSGGAAAAYSFLLKSRIGYGREGFKPRVRIDV